MSELNQQQENLIRNLIRNSLAQYAIAQSPVAGCPDFEVARHHMSVINALEDVESGKCERLMIFMPPQNGKSLLVSKLFPAWYFGRNPGRNVIEAGYGQEFVKGFGRVVRNLVASPLHQTIFPECQISDDSSAQHAFATTAGGEYYAVGRSSATTGRGANIIIIDDPLKDRVEASSNLVREKLKEWYTDVIYTRQRKDFGLIIVMTRWHVDDLAGWLLREHADENWRVLNLPALAEEADLLGRTIGEPLWPSHFPLEKLEQIRRMQSTSGWLSLYQQRPALGSGYLFKREWLESHTYDVEKYPILPNSRSMNRCILVDPANSQRKTSDYTYMWVVGASEDQNYYVLDMVRDRMSLVERGDALFRLHKKWNQPEIVGYEQYGLQADIQYFEDRMKREHYTFRITPLSGPTGKPDRIERLEPLFREGRIYFPTQLMYENKERMREDLVRIFLDEEYTNYVQGGGGVKHDDALDALSRLFDIALTFPTASTFSLAYKLFNRARAERKANTSPWGA